MVHDNPTLLANLFHDMESSSELWKPTNYWKVEQKALMPTLSREGIANFRSSSNSAYITFGVTSAPHTLFKTLNTPAKLAIRLLKMLGLDVRNAIEEHRRTFFAFQNMCFQLVLHCDTDKELLTVADSGLANPRDLFSPEGYNNREYTIAFLRYFWQYLWLKRFVDFKQIQAVMELGSGYGGQAEVICKLHPHITYIICDIPPQLYIAEQYLKSCFPGKVMSYSETARLESIHITQIASNRIIVLAPWQLERIIGNVDLFWNSASFQEMEPNVVRNYISIIQPLTAQYVYLLQLPAGQTIAREKGERYGVLEQTRLEHYVKYFDEF